MKLKVLASSLGFVLFLLTTSTAISAENHHKNKGKQIAYIYDGIGACPEDCAKSAALMAYQAGYNPVYVGPQALTENSSPDYVKHFFDGVKVWIQPGGHSRPAYEAMNPILRAAIVNFVFTGGGYVGFCAGAFITTQQIGTTGTPGFSIFPGKTAPLMPPPARPGLSFSLEEIHWNGKNRVVYFEGGPYLYDLPAGVEVMATYSNGKVAAARNTFGLGRVYITGAHPEAPRWWSNYDGIFDRDGTDYDLAVSMVHWVAQ